MTSINKINKVVSPDHSKDGFGRGRKERMSASLALDDIKPSDLPAPPQAALEMLRACSCDDVDSHTLASFAQSDPVLTAEVLRVVNTPLFGIGKEVISVRDAIALLGFRALRNIILCLMVREAAQSYCRENFDISLFWEDSLRRAVAASLMAGVAGVDKDEAFTAAMMQDFGLLILFYLNSDVSLSYSELRQYNPQQRYDKELRLFGIAHDEIVKVLAKSWSLPNELTVALTTHHHLNSETSALARILHCTDWLDAVFNAQDVNQILPLCHDVVNQQIGMDEAQIQEVFTEIPARVEQAAHVMGLRIKQQADFEQLMRQANTLLAKENMKYQELTWKLEKAIAERDRLSAELDCEIEIAREVQRKFMPDEQANDFPVHGINLPARNVSGDFYDVVKLQNGNIWFTLGDVSGKGINAGLMMVKAVSLFHCLAKHMQDPEKLIRMINNEICETATRGFFVSMVVGLYSPTDKSVRFVNAGHLPVLIDDRDKGITTYPSTDQPVGILPDTAYQAYAPISLQNATLYLYSDGVTESRMKNGEMLEEAGLIEMIGRHRGKLAQRRLAAMVDELKTEKLLHDDLTLLLLEPK